MVHALGARISHAALGGGGTVEVESGLLGTGLGYVSATDSFIFGIDIWRGPKLLLTPSIAPYEPKTHAEMRMGLIEKKRLSSWLVIL